MMASGGYDYEFVPELLDEFICVICHLALRKPKKLIECGHQFCESCLNDMRDYENPGSEMLCPIDRNTFTQGQIFHDKGTERSILKWKVKCPKHEDGCEWIGELNDVEAHKRKCKLNLKAHKRKASDDAANERRDKRTKFLESTLARRSAELSSLKKTVTKLELKITLRDEQFQQLAEELKQYKLDQSNIKESVIKFIQPDDQTGNKVTWRCPYFNKQNTECFSPCFYHRNYCFQFSLCIYNGNIRLDFYRCRGKFDHDTAAITNQLPSRFLFIFGLLNNGILYKKDHKRRQMEIKQNDKRSVGYGMLFRENENFVINGFYQAEGEFMV